MKKNETILESKIIISSNRLLLSYIENIKKNIENINPRDKKGQQLVNELIYYYAWKVAEEEVTCIN